MYGGWLKGYAAYTSSKRALDGFTKVLAKEVQKDGIKVHLISPGGVNTEIVKEMRPDINTDELMQSEEIGELMHFLGSRKGMGQSTIFISANKVDWLSSKNFSSGIIRKTTCLN